MLLKLNKILHWKTKKKSFISVSSGFYLMHQLERLRMNGNKRNKGIRVIISKKYYNKCLEYWEVLPETIISNLLPQYCKACSCFGAVIYSLSRSRHHFVSVLYDWFCTLLHRSLLAFTSLCLLPQANCHFTQTQFYCLSLSFDLGVIQVMFLEHPGTKARDDVRWVSESCEKRCTSRTFVGDASALARMSLAFTSHSVRATSRETLGLPAKGWNCFKHVSWTGQDRRCSCCAVTEEIYKIRVGLPV
jgi:hypothetical protein